MKTFEMGDADLVVCANLLFADAKAIENTMLDGKTLPSSLQSLADERRVLAARMKAALGQREMAAQHN